MRRSSSAFKLVSNRCFSALDAIDTLLNPRRTIGLWSTAAIVFDTEAATLTVALRERPADHLNADALQQSRQGNHSTVQHSHQLAEVAVPPIAATLASDC